MEYRILFSYFLTVPFFVALDLLWIGYLSGNLYTSRIGHLLAPSVNWYAAAAFYLVFTLGLYYFAVFHGVSRQSLPAAVIAGALFGFFAYATYDLTNMATLKNWPLSITLIDMVWGAVLSGAVAAIGYGINQVIVDA